MKRIGAIRYLAAAMGICALLSIQACTRQAPAAPKPDPDAAGEAPAPSAAQTLQQSPQQMYARFYAAPDILVTIDARVDVPQLDKLYRYRAMPQTLDGDVFLRALQAGGSGTPYPVAESPLLRQGSDPIEWGFGLSSPDFLPIQAVNGQFSFPTDPLNALRASQSMDAGIPIGAAVSIAQAAANEMGVDMAVQRASAYTAYPESAQPPDGRIPSPRGFYVVGLAHSLQGIPVTQATGIVSKYPGNIYGSARDEGKPEQYTGLQFVIDGDGIQEVTGAAYEFTELYEYPKILSAAQAVQRIREDPLSRIAAFLGSRAGAPVTEWKVDEITLEYVYDKQTYSQFRRLYIEGLDVVPMWRFRFRRSKGEGTEKSVFVGAADSRILE